MRRRNVWIAVACIAVSCMLSVCVALGVLGSIRYGGPHELWLRARLQLASMLRRPPAPYVPTPLPVTAVTRVVPLPIATVTRVASLPSPTPTPRPAVITDVITATSIEEMTHPTFASMQVPDTPIASPVAHTVAIDMSLVQTPPPPVADDAATSTAAAGQARAIPSAATEAPRYLPAAPSVQLSGITHMWQKWNNCGPATLAMYLSYFGSTLTQAEVAAALKPNWDDKNVSPHEMAAFVEKQGLRALVRVNGDADRVRLLLSNGLPVMIETWLEPEPNDGMGHYRLLTGYDDARQIWIVYDSYVSTGVKANAPYEGIRLAYADVDALWAVFNRTYLLVFTDDMAPVVASILAEEMDDRVMWERALARARAEVASRPDDPFAHFNLGSALTALGEYEQAAAAFDQARIIGLPWRMLWYQFGPFQAYYETGRYAELLALADATIATAGEIEEVYYYKGFGLAALGREAEARQNWQRAVKLNPNYSEAATALATAGGASPSP